MQFFLLTSAFTFISVFGPLGRQRSGLDNIFTLIEAIGEIRLIIRLRKFIVGFSFFNNSAENGTISRRFTAYSAYALDTALCKKLRTDWIQIESSLRDEVDQIDWLFGGDYHAFLEQNSSRFDAEHSEICVFGDSIFMRIFNQILALFQTGDYKMFVFLFGLIFF